MACSWWRVICVVTVALASVGSMAGQIDPATYYLLREGMSMSELLVRAGPPDLITVPGGEVVERRWRPRDPIRQGRGVFGPLRRTEVRNIEEWHYVPGPDHHDPWITIVTFRSGRILNVQRTKVFSRYRGTPSRARNATRDRNSDSSSDPSRANRALEAAEHYAATRARLKEQAQRAQGVVSSTSKPKATKIYRGIDVHGASYFGDTPLK